MVVLGLPQTVLYQKCIEIGPSNMIASLYQYLGRLILIIRVVLIMRLYLRRSAPSEFN